MGNYFWHDQPNSRQDDYIEMLKIIGSLSKLFSDSSDPYLYYRAHENLFCQVFNAKNLARGDVSFDAIADKIGIGLKTFLHGNGRTFQKVAEFNSDSDLIRALQPRLEDVVYKVAELRNRRIRLTEDITNINQNIYHVVTREKGKMNITETAMDYIDISSIQLAKKQSKNTIKFKDKYNEYSFSLSKNTLLKRFDTTKSEIITQFEVEILDDPFNFLKSHHVLSQTAIQSNLEDDDFIILPLYSPSTKNVEQKSGLNQWNAGGRARNINEVYIPIPAWIHRTFNEFFVYSRLYQGQSAKNSPSFNIELPNGEIMSSKVTQQGGKALMSNPNKVLGKWILRDILKLKEGTLVTMDMLDEIGIDSVKLTKKSDDYYYLDFLESGSYEEFEENHKE